MKKPTVVIVKAYSWKSSHLLNGHPEYLAISNIVDLYTFKVNFVVTGTSKGSIIAFRMKNNVTAWDIPVVGLAGHFTYYLQLFRIFLQYRPRLIIVLGLTNVLPALAHSFLSFKSKCIPVFIGEWDYYGRKTVGKLLNQLQFKLMALALLVSRTNMPRMFALSNFVRENIEKMAPNLRGRITLVSYPISKTFCSAERKSTSTLVSPTILTVAGIDPRKGFGRSCKSNISDSS